MIGDTTYLLGVKDGIKIGRAKSAEEVEKLEFQLVIYKKAMQYMVKEYLKEVCTKEGD